MPRQKTKVCSKCKGRKPHSKFYKCKATKDGLNYYCKTCQNESSKVQRKKYGDKYRKQARAGNYRAKLERVNYKGGKCSICSYSKCLSALEFHHMDPSKKDFQLGRRGMSRNHVLSDSIKAELDKCILVCANCHRELHHVVS